MKELDDAIRIAVSIYGERHGWTWGTEMDTLPLQINAAIGTIVLCCAAEFQRRNDAEGTAGGDYAETR
jgi:hypothetical protein